MNRSPIVLLRPLLVLTGLVLVMIVARWGADALGLKAPWYLMHELTVMLVPVVWLVLRVLPRLNESHRIGFVVTCAAFVSLSAIAELLAIQHRYWGFYQGFDPLSGLDLGAIPLEEFLSYPLLLSLPILWFMELSSAWPEEPVLGEGRAASLSRVFRRCSAFAALAAVGFLALAIFGSAQALDANALPQVDSAGAVRYAAGPKHYGWTIVQLLGWAGTFALAAAVSHRIRWRTLAIVVATYFPFALFVELLACGRGWWVWNSQQTVGVFAWVLPLESFSMYLTGALMPVLCFEWLKELWAQERTLRGPAPSHASQ